MMRRLVCSIPVPKCPPCQRGDCAHHQYDYLDADQRVTLCRCPHEEMT